MVEIPLRLEGGVINLVEKFGHLDSVMQVDGVVEEDVTSRIRCGRMKWKEMTGVLCDKKVSFRVIEIVYKIVVRPAVMFGTECWALLIRNENEIEVEII